MHDQIRDMGRMVVAEEGKFGLLKYRGPWSWRQSMKLLNYAEVPQGSTHVHSILESWPIPKLSWEATTVMPELRMAVFESFDEDKKDIHLPKELRWLCWQNCSYPTVTFHNNRHEQLCILDLRWGTFRDFGTRRLVFPQLKVLDLSCCSSLVQTPEFTHLRSLEVLRLDYCDSLAEMDESIRNLKKLVKLSMKQCRKLRGLPIGLCKLTYLEFLDIADCEQILNLPEELGNMKSLKYLNLEHTSISYLPDSIERLSALEGLVLAGCSSLRKIPDSIAGLKIIVSLSHYWRLQPGDIYNKLQGDLEGCILREKLLNSICKLQIVELDGCKSLRSIHDSLVAMENICSLSLCDCESLEELPKSIGKLESLIHLDLSGCTSLRKLPESIGNLMCLIRSWLKDCQSLEELPESTGRLLSLQDLDLSRCISLRKIPESIGSLKNLKRFNIDQCRSLEELPKSMENLKSLKVLHITGGKSIKKVPNFIGKLRSLCELHLREVEEISDLTGGLPELEIIFIKDCSKMESLPDQLPSSLNHLEVLHCSALGNLPSVSILIALKTLHLEGCKVLTSLFTLVLFNSIKKSIFTYYDGFSCYQMDKLSKASFERWEGVFISGASDGSDFLFVLPRGGQVVELLGFFTLIQEATSNPSYVHICVQVEIDGKIVTEGRWGAEKIEGDFHYLEKFGVEGKTFYGIAIGKDEEIFGHVKEGHTRLRVPATYNSYQLKVAYFAIV